MRFNLAKSRTEIQLGQVIGQGGEGTVYLVQGRTSEAAKVYGKPPDSEKVKKLLAMAEAGNAGILKLAAWPLDVLMDNKNNPRGFMMSRITARRDIHELYSPKSRYEAFPEADFRFLVHVASNIARAFAVVHDQGHVLGDINHGNVLVGADGTVTLIDCDSFQISYGSHIFTCDVGSPLFTPPELQNTPFRGLKRTTNHDRFGLAVLLFHLLFMGRHPFAGRYSGPGDMPVERAITEYRFPYGPDHRTSLMERPPGTIALEAMGPQIADLFVRAFNRQGANGQRPDAKTWVEALDALKSNLGTCAKAIWHHYPRELSSCPWCAVETATGVRLFGQRLTATGPAGSVDVGTLWRAISAVQAPGADPPLPSGESWRLPPGTSMPSSIEKTGRMFLSVALLCVGLAGCAALAKQGGFLIGIAGIALAWLSWPRASAEKRMAAERATSTAKAEWEAALRRWEREASKDAFAAKLAALDKVRRELTDLPNERQRQVNVLERGREAKQRERYLDRFQINRAKIKGIGPGRQAMLAAYNVETAADIEPAKILRIPGFGEALTSELVHWRQQHEHNFRFNPNEPVDPRDIALLDGALAARRHALTLQLSQGPATLQRQAQEIVAARTRLMPLLEKAWTGLKVAEAQQKAL